MMIHEASHDIIYFSNDNDTNDKAAITKLVRVSCSK